jgi:D-3-phosphoglycerate dehydrogenase
MTKTVMIFPQLHPDARAILAARKDFIVVEEPATREGVAAIIPTVAAYVVRSARVDSQLIESAKQLGIVARAGVGLDNLDVPALARNTIVLTDAGTANSQAVVEHTFGFMLMLAKKYPAYDRAVREGRWSYKDSLDAIELNGRRLLILGLGRIGSRVAALANAFGLKCLGCDIAKSDEEIRALGCEPVTDWRAILPEVDIVTVHVPLTEETRGFIGSDELARMKKTALLINCARGGIVDEAALIDAMERDVIAGAAIDVAVREPLPTDDPLARCDKILMSPHSAAATAETVRRVHMQCAQNVCDYVDGRLDPALVVNDVLPPKAPN